MDSAGTAADPGLTRSPEPVERVEGWWNRSRASIIYLLFDAMAVLSGVLFAGRTPLAFEALTALCLVATLLLLDLYRVHFTVSVLNDLPRLISSLVIAAAVAVSVHTLARGGVTSDEWRFLAVMSGVLLAGRLLSYELVRQLRKRRLFSANTLVVGGGVVSAQIGWALAEDGSYGGRLVGFVDDSPDPAAVLPAPVVGKLSDLPQIMRDYDARYVIIGFSAVREPDLVSVVRVCARRDAEMWVVPRLFETTAKTDTVDEIDGLPILRLHRTPFRSVTWALKRLFDIAFSGLALVLLSPLLGLIALMDRIVDGPGVIFHQERIGVDGRAFTVLKFRSMRPASETESQTNWNIKNDDRLSWFGRFIRKSSLDELPQLWNILRGDMSFVGPRPERPAFVKEFSELYPRYDDRLRVPCGLTGWAQIHGLRGDTSIEERARYDNYYIENWSLWLDVKIILRTFAALTRGSG